MTKIVCVNDRFQSEDLVKIIINIVTTLVLNCYVQRYITNYLVGNLTHKILVTVVT